MGHGEEKAVIVRVETATFRERLVRAGFDYNDQTNEIVGYWCQNDTGLPMKMTVQDPTNSKRTTVDTYDSGETAKVITGITNEKGEKAIVDMTSGVPTPPFSIEMAYAWRVVK